MVEISIKENGVNVVRREHGLVGLYIPPYGTTIVSYDEKIQRVILSDGSNANMMFRTYKSEKDINKMADRLRRFVGGVSA